MKKILMFTMASCPYCRAAHRWMDEILQEHPQYRDIPIQIIDEVQQPDIVNRYDYYFVPTYYVDGVKVHEGAATKEIVQGVYEKAAQ